MPLRNFFDFLSRGEEKILSEVRSDLQLAIESVDHLLLMAEALKKHDYASVKNEMTMISDIEDQADQRHLRLTEEICRGSFFGGIRENLLELLEEIDNIADNAKDSARLFLQRRIPDAVLDYLFEEDVIGFLRSCIETTRLFEKAVSLLGKNKNEVMKACAEVEKSEENADAIRATILEHLLRNDVKADPIDILMLKDFLNLGDNIADSAEDGSDVLLILVAKGYT